MYKVIIIAILLVSVKVSAQNSLAVESVDSITYQCYLKGDWQRLILVGDSAIKQHIDFKFLRQRMGFAYFIKADYYKSLYQYEKALKFDKTDINTRTYLYYCGLNTGNDIYTRYRGGQLPKEQQQSFGIKSFRIVNSVDVEYNYKMNDNVKRGNPSYLRGGINSELGYRLNLYQTGSTYVQNNDSSSIRQNEYYALLNWTISPHINWGIGYHYMNSKVLEKYSYNTYSDTYEPITVTDTLDLRLRGNMLFSKLTYTLNRFDFTLTGSVLTHDSAVLSGTILKFDSIKLTQQYGIHVGYSFPGKLNIYLKSSLYGLFETDNNKLLINKHLIFTQTAGLLFFKKLWVEGNVTLGYLKNYSDNNGLYIYNSLDPTKFRIGITTYWKIVPNISLFVNYTYDKKLIEKYNTNYNQHSLSSGIIWKL